MSSTYDVSVCTGRWGGKSHDSMVIKIRRRASVGDGVEAHAFPWVQKTMFCNTSPEEERAMITLLLNASWSRSGYETREDEGRSWAVLTAEEVRRLMTIPDSHSDVELDEADILKLNSGYAPAFTSTSHHVRVTQDLVGHVASHHAHLAASGYEMSLGK